MGFKRLSVTTVVLFSFCAAIHAGPVAHVLDTNSYNFQLDGGGGGASAQLDKSQNIEIFCVDFANDIYVPQQNYSAYLTPLTTGSDLSETRFGSLAASQFTQVNISGDATDSSTINSAGALARYQMAAYLISTYNLGASPTNSLYNDGIQDAIWQILDPKSTPSFLFPQEPSGVNPTAALEKAAQWYSTSTQSSLDSFLANYRIVSDTSLKTSCGGALFGCGFQEQITVVPEPRHLALMLIGLLLVGSAAFRKLRHAPRSNA